MVCIFLMLTNFSPVVPSTIPPLCQYFSPWMQGATDKWGRGRHPTMSASGNFPIPSVFTHGDSLHRLNRKSILSVRKKIISSTLLRICQLWQFSSCFTDSFYPTAIYRYISHFTHQAVDIMLQKVCFTSWIFNLFFSKLNSGKKHERLHFTFYVTCQFMGKHSWSVYEKGLGKCMKMT